MEMETKTLTSFEENYRSLFTAFVVFIFCLVANFSLQNKVDLHSKLLDNESQEKTAALSVEASAQQINYKIFK